MAEKVRSEEVVSKIWERAIDKSVFSGLVGTLVGGAASLILFRGGKLGSMGRMGLAGFGGGWGVGSVWTRASLEFEALEKGKK